MPVQYSSIREEHVATRTTAGLFDISHMGRLRFDGPGTAAFLDRLLTRRVETLPSGAVAYSLITNPQGGILDDVLVSHLSDGADQPYYLVVVNAANRTKIVDWFDAHRDWAQNTTWQDVSAAWSMIAVQGPAAASLLTPHVEIDLRSLRYYHATETRLAGHGGVISRTGYTGEDGFELIVGAGAVVPLWEMLFEAAASIGGRAAGLGCRDTLRLEAGMPLYGHELSEDIDPFQAGLGFAVDMDKEFVGRDALVKLKEDKSRPRRVGLELYGRRVPREDYPVLNGSQQVGYVTSGTFSPTLERPIAMAYVEPSVATVGTELVVDIRGRYEPARVVKLPFYRR